MDIAFCKLYFILGEAPERWKRNAIKDPSNNGWANAFVIRELGRIRIFNPYTCEGWEVPGDCYELEQTREAHIVDPTYMYGVIVRNFDQRKRCGLPHDAQSACDVISHFLHMTPPGNMQSSAPQEAPQVTPEKAPKRQSREGLITVASIAERLRITPRIARGHLRDAKIPKPENGWCGDKVWADKIEKVITAGMKAEKKKAG